MNRSKRALLGLVVAVLGGSLLAGAARAQDADPSKTFKSLWLCKTTCRFHDASGQDLEEHKYSTEYTSCATTSGEAQNDAGKACFEAFPHKKDWVVFGEGTSCESKLTPCQ